MPLTGRKAIVTGGSRGLGEAIALAFVEAGATVMVCARDDLELRECQRKHERLVVHRADVSQPDDVRYMFDRALREFGMLHILVNNAAVLGPVGPVETNDHRAWMDTIAVNLGGALNCTQGALLMFMQTGYGKIINIVGGGAADAFPRRTAYACSKAALVRLTDSVAAEARSYGVDVNAVAPGPMATRMMSDTLGRGATLLGQREYADAQTYAKSGPKPIERAAELCTWLASGDSDGLSGRFLAARFDPWPFTREKIEQIMEGDLYTLKRVSPSRAKVLKETEAQADAA